LLPISHQEIQNHLNTHIPEWKNLWAKSYSKKNGTFKHAILEKLQALISNCFAEKIFEDPKITEWLSLFEKNEKIAVRSSGMEDKKGASNPGGNETCSDVNLTPKEISIAIGKVISSYFALKSLRQREEVKDPFLFSLQLSVLLQKSIKENKGSEVPNYSSGVIGDFKQCN
jgi:hypothetical protein